MSSIPANFRDGVLTVTDDNGNSATLLLSKGDQALTGITPEGAALVVSQSRGSVVGLRKGERTFPQLTVSAILAGPYDAFKQLVLGKTSGFVSVADDIGDYPCFDFDWSYDYDAETRDIDGDDVACLGIDFNEGEESTVSFTFQIHGPMNADGNAIISSR